MAKRRTLIGALALVLLIGAGTALGEPALDIDTFGGEIELEWDRPGRTVRYISDDGNIDLRPGVRFHLDFVGSSQDMFNLTDDVEVRKLRLHLRARLWEDWRFKIDGEFSPDLDVQWRNFWLSYRGFERVDIRVGNMIAPVGLEPTISADSLTFMERALPDALNPLYQTGASVRTWTPNWSITGGVFFSPAFRERDRRRSEGVSLSGRITVAPWLKENQVFHVGVSGEYRFLDADSLYRVRQRPESHVQPRLIDTGFIEDGDDAVTYGIESVALWGPVSIQGEFLQTAIDLKGKDAVFEGAYAQLSWFPTGEMRPYSVARGSFGWIKPRRRFGALEIAGRWSWLNLNAGHSGIDGGRQDDWTVGVNWYLNRNIRLMFNAIFVDADIRRTLVNDNPEIYQGRMQVIF